jgi:hypothetical protein
MTYKLNDINFTLGQGGSGRIANGSDYISGMLFYNNTRPSAFADNVTAGGVHQIFSLADAENLGITDLRTDEIKSTATYTVSAIGANGDTAEIRVNEWTGGSGKGLVSLGTYTKVAGDTTVALVAVGVAAAINAGTATHGYTAVAVGAVVTITSRTGTGVYFNAGTPYTAAIVGTIAGTFVQNVIAGVASKLAVYHYKIARHFVKFPDGTLYIGIFNTSGASTFADIQVIQNYAVGSIVKLGIWDDTKVFALASLTLIQTQCDALRASYQYLSNVVYTADIKAISTPLTSLAGPAYNLATLTAKNVSVLIDNDGNGDGFDLFKEHGKTISSLGAAMGCLAEASISENIGNPIDRFNCNDGSEFDTLMFGDGTLYSTVPKSQLDALNNNRYIFLSKIPYTAGSYYSDNHAAIAYTSDYAWMNDNTIIDRVIKDTFAALVPKLKAKLKLNTNGTLTAQTIADYRSVLSNVIKPLIASEDLAGDPNNFDATKWIIIDERQLPNKTGKVTVQIKLAENAIAHSISVPIGYGTF